MGTKIMMSAALALMVIASGCETEPKQTPVQPQSKISVSNTERVLATVEGIDKDNRVLTLRTIAGDVRTMIVDPAVKNFDDIHRGDHVIADYLQQLAVYIEAPGLMLKDDSAAGKAAVATPDKPGSVVVDTIQRRATVQTIDYDSRWVTLQTPDGSLRAIKVPAELGPLDKIKSGDRVLVRYTQMVAVSVDKAAAR